MKCGMAFGAGCSARILHPIPMYHRPPDFGTTDFAGMLVRPNGRMAKIIPMYLPLFKIRAVTPEGCCSSCPAATKGPRMPRRVSPPCLQGFRKRLGASPISAFNSKAPELKAFVFTQLGEEKLLAVEK